MAIRKIDDWLDATNVSDAAEVEKRMAVICDSCSREIDDRVYYFDVYHLCEECYLDKAISKSVEEVLDDTC